MNSRVDGHTCPSTLDCRFSAGRRRFPPASMHPGLDARIPTGTRLRRCRPLQPVRSFDSGRFAPSAQDDKARTPRRTPASRRALSRLQSHLQHVHLVA